MRHTFQWGERTYCVTWPSWTGTELWNLKVRVQRGAYQAFVFKLSSMFWIYYGYIYISTNRYFAIERRIVISVNTLYNQMRMRVFLSLLHVGTFFLILNFKSIFFSHHFLIVWLLRFGSLTSVNSSLFFDEENLVSNELGGFFSQKFQKNSKNKIILLQHFHVCTLLLFWINIYFFCDKICEKKFCWLYYNFCSVFMHTYLTGKKPHQFTW